MPVHNPGISNATRHLLETLANKPKDNYGKEIIKSTTQPPLTQTFFTTRGDSTTNIGDGKAIFWDFSNSDDIDNNPPSGCKKKVIKIGFADNVYIKEGTLYFFESLKGSYVDLFIVCPSGQYYYNRQGQPTQATEDTPVSKYVNSHFICGSCPMGDELNTEACQEHAIPSNYEVWIDVIVPDTDSTSYGYVELEIYRERTILLPGESL